jgi:hypothetical protein
MAAMSQRERMRESVVGCWRGARSPQRFAYLVGGVLVVVGVAHLGAWLVASGGWQGRSRSASRPPSGSRLA